MRKRLFGAVRPLAALTGLLAVTIVAPARADLAIQLSIDGSHWLTASDAPSGTAASYGFPSTATFHGFAIQALGMASDSPGEPGFADLLGSGTSITNTNSGTATLYLKLSDTDFRSPYTPGTITVDSHVGGTVIRPGAANLMTFQSFIDPGDGTVPMTEFTPGPQDKSHGLTITSGSYHNDAFLDITSGLDKPYAIIEVLRITLSPGSAINFSSSTTLASAAPEPSSLVLVGTAAICGALYAWRRRDRRGRAE